MLCIRANSLHVYLNVEKYLEACGNYFIRVCSYIYVNKIRQGIKMSP